MTGKDTASSRLLVPISDYPLHSFLEREEDNFGITTFDYGLGKRKKKKSNQNFIMFIHVFIELNLVLGLYLTDFYEKKKIEKNKLEFVMKACPSV